jgi:HlyD family secretion protein
VKSQISGIVKQYFEDVGQQLKAGDPMVTITPDPTPLEQPDAERAIDLRCLCEDAKRPKQTRTFRLIPSRLLRRRDTPGSSQRQRFLAARRLRLTEPPSRQTDLHD